MPSGIPQHRSLLARLGLLLIALTAAAAIWLPTLHVFYVEDANPYFREPLPARTAQLAARHLQLWEDPAKREQELARMRRSNAEWDFMGRTFLALSLCNLALREPSQRSRLLAVVDQIIDDTLAIEKQHGMHHFLMPYSRRGRFLQQPARSIFVDGEIALMLGARRLVAELPRYREPFSARIDEMVKRSRRAPMRCVESYPDECWMFCNAAAMVAVRMAEVLDGADHRATIEAWLQAVRTKLVHRESGLLVSAFTYQGKPTHGPEGSSIWFVIHCLQALDPAYAKDQYARARQHIGRTLCGFGFAQEWPDSWVGDYDIDSGAVIPLLNVSAGASGMAFLGAGTMRDEPYLRALLATVDFAAFPQETEGRLRYCASNQVGDAVLLYSLVQGPLWQKLGKRP